MIWVDYVILGVLSIFAISGFRKGFVQELLGIAGIILAIMFAIRYFEDVGQIIYDQFGIDETLANVAGFALLALIIAVFVSFVIFAWKRASSLSTISVLDKLFGAGFGVVKGAVILCVILLVLVSIQVSIVQDVINQSMIAYEFLSFSPKLYDTIQPHLPSGMDRLMITPQGIIILDNSET